LVVVELFAWVLLLGLVKIGLVILELVILGLVELWLVLLGLVELWLVLLGLIILGMVIMRLVILWLALEWGCELFFLLWSKYTLFLWVFLVLNPLLVDIGLSD